jgi:hypothetical protein
LALPPLRPDEVELSQGAVYRRFRNHATHFDRERRRITFLAFQPREQDNDAISTLQKDKVAPEDARTDFGKVRGFGLCEVDIARALAEFPRRVSFRQRRSGEAPHVRIYGCDDLATAADIASIARITIEPKP